MQNLDAVFSAENYKKESKFDENFNIQQQFQHFENDMICA
jgi:hypothetical protein